MILILQTTTVIAIDDNQLTQAECEKRGEKLE